MNLYQKLVELRKIVPYLQKDKKGYNYDYVTGTSVLGTIKETMDSLGLLLYPQIPEYEILNDKNDKGKSQVTFMSKNGIMTWLDAESGEKLEIPFGFFGTQDDISKAYGSALTYSERYFLLKFLNIATDKDDPDSFQKKYEDKEENLTKKENENAQALNKITKMLTNAKITQTTKFINENLITKDNADLFIQTGEIGEMINKFKLKSIIEAIKEKLKDEKLAKEYSRNFENTDKNSLSELTKLYQMIK